MIEKKKDTRHDYVLARARFNHHTPCLKCNHIGIVRVQIGDVGTLAKCSCEVGQDQRYEIPTVTNEMKSLPLPNDHFQPPVSPKSQTEVTRFIREKINWWTTKIHLAEAFWSEYGRSGES